MPVRLALALFGVLAQAEVRPSLVGDAKKQRVNGDVADSEDVFTPTLTSASSTSSDRIARAKSNPSVEDPMKTVGRCMALQEAPRVDDQLRATQRTETICLWPQNVNDAPSAMLPLVSRNRGRSLYDVSLTPLALSNHIAR